MKQTATNFIHLIMMILSILTLGPITSAYQSNSLIATGVAIVFGTVIVMSWLNSWMFARKLDARGGHVHAPRLKVAIVNMVILSFISLILLEVSVYFLLSTTLTNPAEELLKIAFSKLLVYTIAIIVLLIMRTVFRKSKRS